MLVNFAADVQAAIWGGIISPKVEPVQRVGAPGVGELARSSAECQCLFTVRIVPSTKFLPFEMVSSRCQCYFGLRRADLETIVITPTVWTPYDRWLGES